jgi:hypothetical protein
MHSVLGANNGLCRGIFREGLQTSSPADFWCTGPEAEAPSDRTDWRRKGVELSVRVTDLRSNTQNERKEGLWRRLVTGNEGNSEGLVG